MKGTERMMGPVQNNNSKDFSLFSKTLIVFLLVCFVFGIGKIVAQTHPYTGTWYLNVKKSNAAGHYVVPAKDPQKANNEDAYYSSNYSTTPGDPEMPYITTIKTGVVLKNAVWLFLPVEGDSNYYYIVHALTGKYVIYRPAYTGDNARRKYVHLEDWDNQGDIAKFEITEQSTGVKIKPKNNTMYFNLAAEAKDVYHGSTGNTSPYYSGIIGGMNGIDDNSIFIPVDATSSMGAPVISGVNPFTNRFAITDTNQLSAGYTILYRTDGSDPDIANVDGDNPTKTYSDSVTLTADCTIKAVIIRNGMLLTAVASKALALTTVDAPTVTVYCDNTVSLSCGNIPAAKIRYTVNGATPTTSTGTLYAGGNIDLEVGDVLRAIAYTPVATSSLTTRTHTADNTELPTITYNTTTITITGSGTIYYTTNGSDPVIGAGGVTSGASPQTIPYDGVSEVEVRAIAKDGALGQSCVTRLVTLSSPTLTVSSESCDGDAPCGNIMTVTGTDDGRTFWFAVVSGNDSPAPDPTVVPNPYTQYTLGSPVCIDSYTSDGSAYYTVYAYAMNAIGDRSANTKVIRQMKTSGKPVLTPPSGSSPIMRIEGGVFGDVAVCTSDQGTPADPSDDISNERPIASDGTADYTIPSTATGTLSVAFKHGNWLTSCPSTYSLPAAPATPTDSMSCDNRLYLNCSDPLADIHYTIDNSEPTLESPTYILGCFDGIAAGTTVRAKSFRGFRSSSELVYVYSKTSAEVPEIFVDGNIVTLSSATEGATIYYTFSTNHDMTVPADPAAVTVDPANLYSSSYTLDGITKFNAIAVKAGMGNSCPVSATTREGYTINTPALLQSIASDNTKWNKYWFIGADIDASGFTATVPTFTGVIEGNFHTISGLSVPLIGTASGSAAIHDLILDEVSINIETASTNVGAIVQNAEGDARIYNCGILSESSSVGGTAYVGGLVGQLSGSARVVNCFSYATITSGTHRGGIVGYNAVASISSNIQTMVMNCLYYGDISTDGSPTQIAPVYGGSNIVNNYTDATNTGLNNYNYFLYEGDYVNSITTYNSALGAESRFLDRFEFFRLTLNSTRDLAAWYVYGDVNEKHLMGKWVLDPSIAPYPILKADGYYPSVINHDAANAAPIDPDNIHYNQGRKLGTLTVNIQMGSGGPQFSAPTGAAISKAQISLNITDKNPDRYDFNYRKVTLPYYSEVGTGNYTGNRVVSGWKIVSINGSAVGTGSFSTDTYDYPSYNFVDRASTKKDLYGVSGRVFNQGAYWEVPDSVTTITIEPYWAKAVYVSDPCYDETYVTTTRYNVTAVTSRPTTFNTQTVYNTVSAAMTALASNTAHTVYDYAVVLVGNFHQYTNAAIVSDGKPVTFMSVDNDGDLEPDYTLFYYHNSRQVVSPVRFDFLNMPGVGTVKRTWDSNTNPQPGIFQAKGWFEITNTVVVRFGQFEYADKNKTTLAPLILQGGIYEQFVSTKNGNSQNTRYIHVGGNAWFKNFANGCHTASALKTPKRPINVSGGEYEHFYLTGIYQPNCAEDAANAVCYVDGGCFGEMAGAGMQVVNGNVTWLINGADIENFFGGGINDAKPITGNVTTTISNSRVTEFYGGPKFGAMASGKTVTTTATNCRFGLFYGAGYGGTAFNRVGHVDATLKLTDPTHWGADRSTYYTRAYSSGNNGISTSYEYEYILHSDGEQTVERFFVNYASLSLASTRDVVTNLTGCEIGNFYGGGRLGAVDGDVSSTLTDCTVSGSVFGSGYSAETPTVMVMENANFVVEPAYNRTAGVFNDAEVAFPGSVLYTWKHAANFGFEDDGDNHYILTTVDLSGLGAVKGNATLTLAGNTVVEGDVYGGGAKSSSNTATDSTATTRVYILGGTVEGSVYGGGMGDADNAVTEGRVEVYIGNDEQASNNVVIEGNVFGCNNANGSPKDSVFVHIWKTKHNANNTVPDFADGDALVAASHTSANFAIQGVYGGGNEANYTPLADKATTVYIHNCDNTVKMVYGGGRAAAVGTDAINANTFITVDGGRIDTLFAGGDGHTTTDGQPKSASNDYRPANIYGNVSAWVRGGYYTAVFGASNTAGTISGTKTMTVDKSGPCESTQDELVGAMFGGGNMAPIEGDVSLTIGCGAGYFHEVYGGCNMANITGNVTLTVEGGSIDNVYGGSKGVAVGDPTYTDGVAANIDGNVTLNIYGGTIGNAFGGSNINGNINGRIDVIVDWNQSACTDPKQLDNVYGGSNLAQYNPQDTNRAVGKYTPLVSLINGTVGRDDFDPDDPDGHACVFGGGRGSIADANAGKVNANPKVWMKPTKKANLGKYEAGTGFTVRNTIYGGGEVASVSGSTLVQIDNGYVGCPDQHLDHDNGYVFGAGKGDVHSQILGSVSGNSTVTMSSGYVHNTLFGGGQLASVGTITDTATADDATHDIVRGEPIACQSGTGTTTVIISGGQIGPTNVTMQADLGYVFGGGMGYYTQPYSAYADPAFNNVNLARRKAVFGYAYNTEVTIRDSAFIVGAVWGGSENGQVLTDCHVVVKGGQIGCGKNKTTPYTKAQWTEAKEAVETGSASRITAIAVQMPECESWIYAYPYLPYDPYAPEYDPLTYDPDTRDACSSGDQGDGHTFFGNVFGGGSGYYPYRISETPGDTNNVWFEFQGRVRGNTLVEVSDSAHILTSLYGGCEYADVVGNCTVRFTGGTLGVPRTVEATLNHPVTCYLFGAGKGDQRTTFNMRTNVENAYVTVSDSAVIFGSVFGGGEDGHVNRNTEVTISGKAIVGTWGTSYYDGNIFGGGRGFGGTALTAGSIGGNATVNINGDCKVLGNVYGGGRLASVGLHFCASDDPKYGVLQGDAAGDDPTFKTTRGNIFVNISGGTIGSDIEFNPAAFSTSTDYVEGDIVKYNDSLWRFTATHNHGAWNRAHVSAIEHTTGGNVFGSSMGRVLRIGSSNYADWRNFNPLWPGLAKCRNTVVTISDSAEIKSNVYGGGELGYVMKNTRVIIQGGTVGTRITPSGGDYHYKYIGSVFGGGYGCDNTTDHYNDSTSVEGYVKATMHAGRVYGNASVEMSGGHVRGNVYGGGELASVGRRWRNMTTVYSSTTPYVGSTTGSYNTPAVNNIQFTYEEGGNTYTSALYNIPAQTFTYYPWSDTVGNTTVAISGGIVGEVHDTIPGTHRYAGHPTGQMGYVFGGSKGRPGLVFNGVDYGLHHTRMAYVDSAKVTISGSAMIAASVFGGGENGHVRYGTGVYIEGGTIGLRLSDHFVSDNVTHRRDSIERREVDGQGIEIYFGNVYGGGRGIDAVQVRDGGQDKYTYSLSSGRVYGNTNVEISGGHVTHNVYGGGSLASVGITEINSTGTARVTITGGVVGFDDGHTTIDDVTGEFKYDGVAYDKSQPSAAAQLAVREYYLRAGINGGRVYGSGRGHAVKPGDLADYRRMAYVKNSYVTIGDGTGTTNKAYVHGSVFGGGANGHVRQDTHVKIRKGAIIGLPLMSLDDWGLKRWLQTETDGYISHDTMIELASSTRTLSKEYYDSEKEGGTNATFNGAHLHEHWESDNGTGPTVYRGNVYGGGRGITPTGNAGQSADLRHYSATAGRVYGNVYLTIDGGRIFHNVYGGGSLASVGNTVDSIYTADKVWFQAADGAGIMRITSDNKTAANRNDGDMIGLMGFRFANYPARLDAGQTPGGTLYYLDGTSESGDARYHYLKANPNGQNTEWENDAHVYVPGDPINNTGTVTVTVNGGIIGTDGINDGQLYGSGRGIAGAVTSDVSHLANATNTVIYIHGVNGIDNANTATGTDGANIRGAVFGGGANGHVIQNTQVYMTGGTVGVPLPLAERKVDEATGHGYRIYRGNIYGGGRGVDPFDNGTHLSTTAGRVYGNTRVEVSGGTVYHAVYGGGSLASVGSYALRTVDGDTRHFYIQGTGQASVTVKGDAVIGHPWRDVELVNADGTNKAVSEQDAYSAQKLLHIIGQDPSTPWGNLTDAQKRQYVIELNYHFLGSNSGMVFGSGRGVGALHDGTIDHDYSEAAFTRNTIVNVENSDNKIPIVCGSVFGGGENGHVKHHTLVQINGGVIGAIPLHDDHFITNDVNHYNIDLSGYSSYRYSQNPTDITLSNLNFEDSENSAGHGPAVYRGNVYGGGRGVDHTDSQAPEEGYSATAGRVYGNVEVNILGGVIYHHVFGGGSLASVGTYETDVNNIPTTPQEIYEYQQVRYNSGATRTDDRVNGNYCNMRSDNSAITNGFEPDTLYVLVVDQVTGSPTTGDIEVSVYGGQVGRFGINEGSVFGGGRGIAGSGSDEVTHMAYANNTFVNIFGANGTDTENDKTGTTGADIRGSVFGGGANGHVLQDARVVMTGGNVGATLSADDKLVNEYGEAVRGDTLYVVFHGNVYGGGRGVDPIQSTSGSQTNFSYTAGRVYGNSYVTINGGTVQRNVYGGGSLATVGTVKYAVDATALANEEYTSIVPVLKDPSHPENGYWDHTGKLDPTTGAVTVNIGGSAVIGTDGMNNGRVFGSCRGMAGVDYSDRAYVYKSTVTVGCNYDSGTDTYSKDETCTAVVNGCVFGSGENGHVDFGGTKVIIGGGTIGHDVSSIFTTIDGNGSLTDEQKAAEKKKYDYIGNVYGGGRGVDFFINENNGVKERWNSYSAGYVRGNTEVNILGGTIHRNVYGGGSMGLVGDYGPLGQEESFQGTVGSNGIATVNILSSVGSSAHPDYGGNVFGSSRGRANDPSTTSISKGAYDPDEPFTADGYFAEMAYVFQTIINVGKADGGAPSDLTIYGSVYGGGENGHVDYGGTEVNILSGTINGNVFGGGAGSTISPTAGIVDGNTQVNIGSSTTYGEATIVGAVFGGNDTYSSPLGIMRVDVYKTYRSGDTEFPTDLVSPTVDTNTLFSQAPERRYYALSAVYGGGNNASVLTGDVATDAYDHNTSNVFDTLYRSRIRDASWNSANGGTPRKSVVYVHGCDNTIMYVYGGGNAANTIQNDVTIEGGRIYRVFAGGNGEGVGNPGANVGMADGNKIHGTTATTTPHTTDKGDAQVDIKGGIVYQTFGGSNSKGMIYGASSATMTEGTCQRILNEIYGGGNQAPGGNITVELPCLDNSPYVPLFFAGARNADIGAPGMEAREVHLIINGGNYGQVFGGNNQGGVIYGNITVDVHGGNIHQLFGGNNAGGNVVGNITVNIEDTSAGCPLNLDYVYGGGYNAHYLPDSSGGAAINSPSRFSPEVNVIQGTVNQAVFGGGYGVTAEVKANPVVNISPTNTAVVPPAASTKTVYIGNINVIKGAQWGAVFGGGNAAQVSGNTKVVVGGHKTSVGGNVFGGGNEAKVTGNTEVFIIEHARLFGNVYGGGNQGEVEGDTKVIVNGAPEP